jgi:hypothetical protein
LTEISSGHGARRVRIFAKFHPLTKMLAEIRANAKCHEHDRDSQHHLHGLKVHKVHDAVSFLLIMVEVEFRALIQIKRGSNTTLMLALSAGTFCLASIG